MSRRNLPIAIACTLSPEQVPGRVDEWRALVAEATARDGGTLRFPPSPELAAKVGALAASEQSCCSFLTFDIHIDATGTTLTVGAPDEASSLVDALLG